MQDELKKAIAAAAKSLFSVELEPELSRPAEQFGDYATNVALQLAGQLNKKPLEIAQTLAPELENIEGIQSAAIAGPGFINFKLTDKKLSQATAQATDLPKPLAGQEVLVEFGQANPFKEMHVGHLYNSVVGDAIASLMQANGAGAKRLNYHGDVGLHVAKAIWAMQKAGIDTDESQDIGQYYAQGTEAYDDDEQAKKEIQDINAHIYAKDDPEINKLYDWGIKRSFSYLDDIFGLLQIKYDKRYLESQSQQEGLAFVKAHKKVFASSQGAVVYEGEKAGLHTRVFITSKGLPTYETKDLGLVELKNQDYPRAARSIIITGNEQSEYFKVMLAALAEIDAQLAKKTTHLSHGFVSLTTGKMSSRTGDVYGAMELLLEVKDAVHSQYPDSPARKPVTFAAVKYAFLKHRLGSDIVLDIKESISLEGNSGPYFQYAHARASSILAKAKAQPVDSAEFDASERSLARKISEYPEVVQLATAELMPHHICTYLYELAQTFNKFY